MTHSLVTSLAAAVEQAVAKTTGVVAVWLFGSTLSAADPSDVDLLVVYRGDEIHPEKAALLRNPIRDALAHVTDLEADVVILSEVEAVETGFVNREGAQLLYSRSEEH